MAYGTGYDVEWDDDGNVITPPRPHDDLEWVRDNDQGQIENIVKTKGGGIGRRSLIFPPVILLSGIQKTTQRVALI